MSEPTNSTSPYLIGTKFQLYARPPPELPTPLPKWNFDKNLEWRLPTAQQRFPPILSEDSCAEIELKQLFPSQDSRSGRPDGVWKVHVATTNTAGLPSTLIAKFSDPVYHFQGYCGPKMDSFTRADHDIAQEYQAYGALKDLQGKIVPRCYGHYLANLPSPQCRTVSVILIECIDGADLESRIYARKAWTTVCDRHNKSFAEEAFRINWSVLQYRVGQKDMASRNFILRTTDLQSKQCTDGENCPFDDGEEFYEKLVMIDFEAVKNPFDPGSYETFREKHFKYGYLGMLGTEATDGEN